MKYIYAVLTAIFGFIAFIYTIAYFEMLLGLLTPIEIPIVIEGTQEYTDIEEQLIGQDVFSIILIIVCIFLASIFYSKFHRTKRKKKDTFDKDSIKGPFSLYLRSFADDKTTMKRISFINDIRSEEEVLVDVLSEIAPVYAIGDPKDKKMPLGASRVYVDDEHWKSTVTDLMNRATIVALRLGKTNSFWWEVETAIKNIPLDKLIFIVPESKTFSDVAVLYKILIDNNIDIKQLDVNIERKRQGSISSFLYFDKDGNAVNKEVKAPRFTRLIISYDNILKNALDGFRRKFGLTPNHKQIVKWARLVEFLLIGFILYIGATKTFGDLMNLKYQMPYELVEECVKSQSFVEKYSDEINGTNLTWSLVEAQKGYIGLDDEKYALLFLIEAHTFYLMTYEEYEQINSAPKNKLLMVKKYLPDYYDTYIELVSEATIIAIQHSDDINNLVQLYKSNVDSMPQWLVDFFDSDDLPEDEYEFLMKFNELIVSHIDDDDIGGILKTMACVAISE